jgi:hypothetical protein
MNFVDTNKTNLIKNLEINTLEPLKRNGLILDYKQIEGLQGMKYEIKRANKREANLSNTSDKMMSDKEDVGIGKEGGGVRKTKTDVSLTNH